MVFNDLTQLATSLLLAKSNISFDFHYIRFARIIRSGLVII